MGNRRLFFTKNGIFGLLVGMSFIAASYAFQLAGQVICINPQLSNTLLLLAVFGAFIGVRKYRDEQRNGLLSYSGALGASLYISIIASFIYSVYTFLLYHFNPELQATYLQIILQMLDELYQNIPQLEEIKAFIKTLITPGFIAFSEFINKILTSFLFSLFLAFLLKRKVENTI